MSNSIVFNMEPLEGKLHEFLPLDILIVDQTEQEALWDAMVKSYHYLGYQNTIGQRIKYLVFCQGQPIAALGYNRAALHVGVREAYVGWDKKRKLECLPLVVNNYRFLILPWIRIKNLASYLLSQTLRCLRTDWHDRYGVMPILAETFVDHEHYRGTCYLAANWKYLGETKGYGKSGNLFVYHGNRKGVYIYELDKKEMEAIRESCHQTLKTVRRREPYMMLQKPDWNPGILTDAGITEDMVRNLGNELDDFLLCFDRCFRYEQGMYAATYLKGLMSDLEYKSAEPIALRYGLEPRNMQRFLRDGKWDEVQAGDTYRHMLSGAIAHADAMVTVDGCDVPKKGYNSVGVARQYCGAAGKIDNCQAGVYVGYSGPNGYGLIDRRLYLPGKWFEDSHRSLWEECGIPDNTVFQTKTAMAAEMVQDVFSSGLFPARWVGADSFFGGNREFLRSLPEGVWYFADIPSDTLVFRQMPTMETPPYSGRGRRDLAAVASIPPVRVSSLADDAALPWRQVCLGEGAKGPIFAQEKCIRVVISEKNAPMEEVWLYIRRLEDGNYKYSFCNAPADTAEYVLRSAALMRWPIEQCFEECKSLLGLDQYEGRSWNTWHRHTLMVFVAHLFLTGMRLKYKKKTVCLCPGGRC